MNTLNPAEAWDFLQKNKGSILVDVRAPEEWKTGVVNIEDSGNNNFFITISTNSDEFVDKLQQNIKNLSAPILFLCYGGVRSKSATMIAEKAGYNNCYNISGGFSEWSKLGLPQMVYEEKR